MLHGRLLHYLDEVARCGSIRRAGERLNVASSAINRQILTLEEQLGTPIFQRLPRKLVLTSAGEILIAHVRQSLKGMERALGQIEELKGQRRGEVSLAVMSGLAATLVPLTLSRFRQSHGHARLRVELLSGEEIIAAVEHGECDLGLGFDLPIGPHLHVFETTPCRLGAVMRPDHPLAGRAGVRISDCIGYPLFVGDASMAIRPYLDSAFARAGVALNAALETNSIEVMRRMALTEDAITFLTPFDILLERRAGQLAFVPLRDAALQPQHLILAGRKRGTTPLASTVAEIVRALMQQPQ